MIEQKNLSILSQFPKVRQRRIFILTMLTDTNPMMPFNQIREKLMKEFNVTERTAYRDIKAVQDFLADSQPNMNLRLSLALEYCEMKLNELNDPTQLTDLSQADRQKLVLNWLKQKTKLEGLEIAKVEIEGAVPIRVVIPKEGAEAAEEDWHERAGD